MKYYPSDNICYGNNSMPSGYFLAFETMLTKIHNIIWPQGVESLNLDGLVQERSDLSALAMELRLSCTNQSIWFITNIYKSAVLYFLPFTVSFTVRIN